MEIPKLKKMPKQDARRAEQACHIWIILTGWITHNKNKTITYGQLAEILGYTSKSGVTLSTALGIASKCCLYNNLPPISCIVVDQKNQMPQYEGLIPEWSTVKKEQKKVWNIDWYLFRTPTVGTLRKIQSLDMSELVKLYDYKKTI